MKLNVLLTFLIFCLLTSCESTDPSIETSVFTEEVVFTSGEKVILTGRILAIQDITLSDHGFQISESEDFSNNEVISLGERSVPGRFVGEFSELNSTSAYFCRAYIVENGVETVGNILDFSTLSPRVIDFEPKEGTQNTKITIEGVNITSSTVVLWNDQVITPNAIVEESFIEITAPAPDLVPYANLKVVSQGDTVSIADRFEYIYGAWEDVGMIVDSNKNDNHIYFEDLDYFYFGLGISREFFGPSPIIYRLNKTTLDGEKINHSGFATEGSFYTKNGYFGGGSLSLVSDSDPTLLNNSQFFILDGDGTKKLKDIPALLYKAVAFAHEDYVYVYGGEDPGRNLNTKIYRYDIANDAWENTGDSPFGTINEYPNFKIGNKNYFIEASGQMHSHNISTNTWEVLPSFPDEVKIDGISVVLDGSVYVGLQEISRKIYEYLPDEMRWRKKKSNPTSAPSNTLGSWINDDKIYIMRNSVGPDESKFFWSFDPAIF